MFRNHKSNDDLPASTLLKLLRRTTIDPLTDCMEWAGAIDSTGYGAVKFNGKKTNTHRLVATRLFGTVSSGIDVCHHCDNRLCINPLHLFLGTRKDNMQDALGKNRLHQPNPPGCKIVASDLTKESLQLMLAEFGTIGKVAGHLGCHHETVSSRCQEWGIKTRKGGRNKANCQ